MNQFHITNLADGVNWLRKQQAIRAVFGWAMVVVGPVLLVLTISTIRSVRDAQTNEFVRVLLFLDLIYALIIIAVVSFSILKVIAARRAGSAGSRLHMRLSGAFAFLAMIPTILVAVFAMVTINFGLEAWFSDRVRDVVGHSLSAAQAYQEEQERFLIEDSELVALSLNQLRQRQFFVDEGELRIALTELQGAVQRGLKEAYIIDGAGEIRARGEQSYLFDYEQPGTVEIDRAEQGELVVIEDWQNNEFRALVRLGRYVDRFLYVSRVVDGELLTLLDDTQATVGFYNQMESERERRLFDFGLMYLAFAAIIILSAIWVGLAFAERLARPVGRLAGAARAVGQGDLSVQVEVDDGKDEIALLGRTFNNMTRQVKAQRDDLIEINEQTERRRRLFDSVLAGVTAGVIGVSPDGNVTVLNDAAKRLLNLKASDIGQSLTKAVPEFAHLFAALKENSGKAQTEEVSLTRAGNAEVLMVRMVERNADDALEGYVVTFDDVTSLVSAQRMAAWGDVARRIAHEIKNPLTPIQLSAERMRRKFGPALGDKAEELNQYSDVIIRQTNDLRRIVDEFSKFARMPQPEKKTTDLADIVADAVLLQREALAPIALSFTKPKKRYEALVDQTMISEALTNLIKNAGEAIQTRQAHPDHALFKPEIRISMKDTKAGLVITVADNGIGLPKEQRSRLFEPYVTHRDDGTGLGLPIVKKIIEEHQGTLELVDAPRFGKDAHVGALARITLPSVKGQDKQVTKADRKTAA